MTLALTIDTAEWDKLADDLAELDDRAVREIRLAVRKSVSVMETNIVGFTPIGATKNLSQSWGTEVRTMPAGIRGIVGSPLVYAPAVELGRKPGKMPPVDAIRLWVVRKGIAPVSEAESVAFLIARAIGRRGTKAQKMMEKGVRRSEPLIQRIFDDALARLLRTLR